MNKKQKSIIAIFAIFLIVFNLLYFFIPFPKKNAAWVCYSFSMFSFVFGCVITLISFTRDEPLRSKVYGYPIFRMGTIYISAQISFSMVIFLLGFVIDVPVWVAVVVSAVDLAYALIGVIVAENAKDVAEEQEHNTIINTKKMTAFKLDISYVVDKCQDPALKKSLEKLYDDFKYSDPVSNDALAAEEENIAKEVELLDSLVNVDNAAAEEKIQLVSRLLVDRNRKCKAYKQ